MAHKPKIYPKKLKKIIISPTKEEQRFEASQARVKNEVNHKPEIRDYWEIRKMKPFKEEDMALINMMQDFMEKTEYLMDDVDVDSLVDRIFQNTLNEGSADISVPAKKHFSNFAIRYKGKVIPAEAGEESHFDIVKRRIPHMEANGIHTHYNDNHGPNTVTHGYIHAKDNSFHSYQDATEHLKKKGFKKPGEELRLLHYYHEDVNEDITLKHEAWSKNQGPVTYHDFTIHHNGNQIGHIAVQHDATKKNLDIGDIQINKEHQGKFLLHHAFKGLKNHFKDVKTVTGSRETGVHQGDFKRDITEEVKKKKGKKDLNTSVINLHPKLSLKPATNNTTGPVPNFVIGGGPY